MAKILSTVLYAIVWVISLLPMPVLYLFSDIAWLVMFICPPLRYRKSIVQKNLALSFPDRDRKWLRRTERRFYYQFACQLMESLKTVSASRRWIERHLVWTGYEKAAGIMRHGQSIICYMGHMGNWEWLAEVQQSLDEGITEVNVYRQLKSPKMDALMLAIRAQREGVCVEKRRILREMVRFRAEQKKVTIGLICDQKPRPEVTRTWVEFLHQDTGFLDGGEVLGTKFGYPVFYAYVRRLKRGCYEAELQLLTAEPKSCAEGEITKAYAQALERNILEQPELWLWTHNRWKWKREI